MVPIQTFTVHGSTQLIVEDTGKKRVHTWVVPGNEGGTAGSWMAAVVVVFINTFAVFRIKMF